MAFEYFLSVTGDCQSTISGVATLTIRGGSQPYTVDNVCLFICFNFIT